MVLALTNRRKDGLGRSGSGAERGGGFQPAATHRGLLVPDDNPRGHVARLSLTTASTRLRGAAMALACPPLYARPGSYLSPLTSEDDIRRALSWRDTPPGITLREDSQEEIAAAARAVLESPEPGPRYRLEGNTMFGSPDAAVYRAVIGRYRPRRIIEAGSGFST